MTNTNSRGRSLGEKGISTTLGLVINGVCRFGMSLSVGRFAGTATLGVFQASLSTAQFATLMGPTALGSVASSFLAKSQHSSHYASGEVESQIRKSLAISLFAINILYVGVAMYALGTEPTLVVANLVLISSLALFSVARGRLYGNGQVTRAVRWGNVTNLASMVSVSVAAIAGAPVEVMVAAVACSYFVYAAANGRKTTMARPAPSLRREVNRFTVLVMIGTLASTGLLEASMLLAAAIGNAIEVGQYGAAFVIATPASLIGSAASLVLFPALSAASVIEAKTGAKSEGQLVDVASRLLAATIVPFFALLIMFAEPLVRLAWGSEYEGVGEIVAPLLLSMCVTTLAIPAVNDLTTRSPRGVVLSAALSGVGAVSGAVSWLYFVPEFGMAGIAYGYLTGASVGAALSFLATWVTVDLRWGRHSAELILALAFLGIAPQVLDSSGTHPSSVLALALFLGFWGVLNRTAYLHLINLTKRLIRRG